jgi:hypothetical protein
MRNSFIFMCFLSVNVFMVNAQAKSDKKVFPNSNKFSVQTGLLQDLLLDGQNIVISYTTNRWVFDWSHGNSLDFSAGKHFKNNESYNVQKLDVHVPWTTGPSIGYRLTPYFNIRGEFKAHHNEVRYQGSKSNLASYNTYTIGVGAFYEWYPFKKSNSWMKGILIEPVIRFWPNVGTSLSGDFAYLNNETGKVERLEAYKLGWLGNINVGYTFGRK